MILAALSDYYDLISSKANSEVAKPGFSSERLDFCLVLDLKGNLVDIEDLRDLSGKKPRAKRYMVPAAFGRSGRVLKPFNFWDKTSYLLGISKLFDEEYQKSNFSSNFQTSENLDEKTKEQLSRLQDQYKSFKKHHLTLLENVEDAGAIALIKFLNDWEPLTFYENPKFSAIADEFIDSNITFRIEGDGGHEYIYERSQIKRTYLEHIKNSAPSEVSKNYCLISGELEPIARLHGSIRGVDNAQSSGAAIVSFNQNAFESYGKKQGENSPVGEEFVFAYTTALNYLLRRDNSNRQRLKLGDTTVVFWAQANSQTSIEAGENLFAAFIDPEAKDEQETEKLRRALDAIRQGRPLTDCNSELTDDIQIFILGLAPNAARLSIRFWQVDSLQVFAERLAQHYEDLRIEPLPWQTPPAIWRLLQTTAPIRQGKSKNEDIPPHLAGEITRAVLTGNAYPYSLLSNLIMRFRADGEVTGLRVALIKAVITRFNRLTKTAKFKGEMPLSLDTTNTQPGYLLGRLFAALEKIQQDALGGNVNATIRDRYYGAASATPAHIFPMLLRNTQNHLGKVRKDKPGLAVNREKIIGEVLGKLGANFPKSLRMEAQGQFALGYYQQRQFFYSKKENTELENLTEDEK